MNSAHARYTIPTARAANAAQASPGLTYDTIAENKFLSHDDTPEPNIAAHRKCTPYKNAAIAQNPSPVPHLFIEHLNYL